jgi:S-disulfanyl-L-cysteine oxidoreductase SoxD
MIPARTRQRLALATALLALSPTHASTASQVPAPAPHPQRTTEGVYIASQARDGKLLYSQRCTMCHGANLQGTGPAVQLGGEDFIAAWSGRTLGELFVRIQSSMPPSHPGTLTPEETSQLIAFILSANTFPDGLTPLPKETAPLESIQIDSPRKAASGSAGVSSAGLPVRR